MKREVTRKSIARLPKWAQVYIKELERDRDTAIRVLAIRALTEYLDGQIVPTGTQPASFVAKENID